MNHPVSASSKLVPPAWIDSRDDFLLFEVGSDTGDEYRAGHIPGALYLDTNLLERPPLWNRLPDDELERALTAQGITHNKPVILYARGSTAAARVGVILLYAGVRDVRLLDGGFGAWLAAGYPVETGENRPVPAAFGVGVPGWPDVFVDMQQVKTMLNHQDSVLVSVRSWAEYTGQTSGYDFIQPKGRIAGAVWGGGGADKDRMDDFRNPDGTTRSLSEIAARWRKRGITPEKRIAFYCGTGWRASEAFFYAYAMDWKTISVYDGGWLEWSSDPKNPIETGTP